MTLTMTQPGARKGCGRTSLLHKAMPALLGLWALRSLMPMWLPVSLPVSLLALLLAWPARGAAVALPEASEEQRQAAQLVFVGDYMCEFGRVLRVRHNPRREGYLDLQFGKTVVTARPVVTPTGAIRLEDLKGHWMLLQIAMKSMLLDVRAGRRLADECLHDSHLPARREAHDGPPVPGLGIAADHSGR